MDAFTIHGMIEHWLHTPAESYLGSNYGNNIKDALMLAMQDGAADEFIAKMRRDIPILEYVQDINIYSVGDGIDSIRVFIEVNGNAIEVPRAYQTGLS